MGELFSGGKMFRERNEWKRFAKILEILRRRIPFVGRLRNNGAIYIRSTGTAPSLGATSSTPSSFHGLTEQGYYNAQAVEEV